MKRIDTEKTRLVLDMMGDCLKDKERADMLGVTPNTLSNWRKDGMPETHARQAYFYISRRIRGMADRAKDEMLRLENIFPRTYTDMDSLVYPEDGEVSKIY